jgi:hypothetical protein
VILLVRHVADPADEGVTSWLEPGKAKTSAVMRKREPVSASLDRQGKGQPPRNGEACYRPRSNEHRQRSMLPGVRADGGCRKINQEPGRPGEVAVTRGASHPTVGGNQ